VRQVAFLIKVEETENVSSKFYVISVITKMFVEEAEGKRQVGHVGVKLEIRASVTVLDEMSTCSLVVINLPFGGVWFLHMQRRRLKIKEEGFFETSEPTCQTTHYYHIPEHPNVDTVGVTRTSSLLRFNIVHLISPAEYRVQ